MWRWYIVSLFFRLYVRVHTCLFSLRSKHWTTVRMSSFHDDTWHIMFTWGQTCGVHLAVGVEQPCSHYKWVVNLTQSHAYSALVSPNKNQQDPLRAKLFILYSQYQEKRYWHIFACWHQLSTKVSRILTTLLDTVQIKLIWKEMIQIKEAYLMKNTALLPLTCNNSSHSPVCSQILQRERPWY